MQSLRDRVRKGDPIPFPLAPVLHAASGVTRLGMAWRLRQPRTRVDARVVSFGNLTAGGAGKTPAVVARAAQELADGHRVAVLTRGYGSAKTEEPLILAPDLQAEDVVRLFGDEPAMIRRRVPEIWLVKAADRVAGARAACAAGIDVILLDDGFQAVQLHRDENVLLVNAKNPFGNGYLVPRGILREPETAAARATRIVLTHCDRISGEALEALEARLARLCPGVPVAQTWHRPEALLNWGSGTGQPPEALKGSKVVAVCGIAHPESFAETLESLGATVAELRAYPDHGTIPAEAFKASLGVVTTEKDAVRAGDAAAHAQVLTIGLAPYP